MMRIMEKIDDIDRKILHALQRDCAQSLEQLSDQIGLSRNACWKRIKTLQDTGVIRSRVALLDADKIGLGLQVFLLIKAGRHDAKWLDDFAHATRLFPEITSVHRMSGDLDYLLRARVPDMAGYDWLYKRLIKEIDLADVSASFVMETLKDTTALPL